MARAKLTARTFSTEVTPLPGSWTFREGRAALKRLPEEYRCCYLIYNSCRFEEFGDSARYSRLHAPVETGTAPRRRSKLHISRFRQAWRKLAHSAAPPLKTGPALLGSGFVLGKRELAPYRSLRRERQSSFIPQFLLFDHDPLRWARDRGTGGAGKKIVVTGTPDRVTARSRCRGRYRPGAPWPVRAARDGRRPDPAAARTPPAGAGAPCGHTRDTCAWPPASPT